MVIVMEDQDRLEAKWRSVASELKKKRAEIEELERKFKILDDARVLILSDDGALPQRILIQPRNAPQSNEPKSLREEVLNLVRQQKSERGISAAELVPLLKGIGYVTESASNSFYSAVYVTLKRLAQKGEIDSYQGERGLMFKPKGASPSLFSGVQQ
jgi:hypothetical protein